MAEAIFSSLISLFTENLASPLLDMFRSIYGVEEINKLRSNFTSIRAVLEDAEEQQWSNNFIRDWLNKLEAVAYDMEDILDEFATEDLRRSIEDRHPKRQKLLSIITTSVYDKPAFNLRMTNKVREVLARLDVITQEKSEFELKPQEDADRRREIGTRDPTHSFVEESEFCGRDKEKEELVQRLVDMGNEDTQNVSVVAIVGMGGLGKTTLAQSVYNYKRVEEHFEKRLWAFVGEKFDTAEIMRKIIASAEKRTCDLKDMDPLQSRLREILTGKKYLLVLDDVWNEKDQEDWHQLKSILNVGARGSKIIATTRSKKVASIMSPLDDPYELKGLSNDDCWNLFKQRAFPRKDEENYPHLVGIGKKIVEKCEGLPLAAKVLGGSLLDEKRERKWRDVVENDIWKLNEDKIIPSLKLSYNHLPSPLKQCFTYCSIFPKGYALEKDKIIQLWIAQGFIKKSEYGDLAEDVAREYFDELCSRSLLQREYGEWECKMHDLIHDLGRSIGRTERFIVDPRREDVMGHHIANKLRAIIFKSRLPYAHEIEDHAIISSITFLRVLDLSSCEIKTLPNSIGELKHLRYLDLSDNPGIETLPESICTLCNLQTLKLKYCWRLRELPNNMWMMISLRHLENKFTSKMTKMPMRIGELRDLQTLSVFVVSNDSGIEQLQCLKLRGELSIRSLENVQNPWDAEKARLREKEKLDSLSLSWKEVEDDNVTAAENDNYDRVIECLQPHSSLKRLEIKNYMGARFPDWLMRSKVHNLVAVSLINCRRCKILPPLLQLQHLRFLTINGMHVLEKWSSDEMRQTLPHIVKLEIIRCHELTQLPHLPSVKTLELRECNEKLLMSLTTTCPAISSLRMHGFPEMTSLPDGFFENKTLLYSLYIIDCPVLKSLSKDVQSLRNLTALCLGGCEEESLMKGVCNLTSLRYFSILRCKRIESLPDEGFQGLPSLQALQICECENLRSLGEGLQHLKALESLTIYHCPKLAALPGSLYKLTTLKSLDIKKLHKLASLSEEIGNLTSLEKLYIIDCPDLWSLPESLQKVTTLRDLAINACKKLEERVKVEGEDWRKIAHVPTIRIGGQEIQKGNEDHYYIEFITTVSSFPAKLLEICHEKYFMVYSWLSPIPL